MIDGLELRPASADDRDAILEWANDAETRANSFRNGPIEPGDHARWFAAQLTDPAVRIWLLVKDGARIAQVRYSRSGDSAEVSISVAPAHRGRGYGTAILNASADLAGHALGVAKLVALVLPANAASVRAFAKAGYAPAGEELRHGKRALRFERAIWR